MRALYRVLLDLLYPPKCVFCGRLLERSDTAVCAHCETEIPVLDGADGVRTGHWFRTCTSCFSHEGPPREVLIRFKYQRQMYCGAFLGRRMADCARSQLEGRFDLVTWVPVHRRRRRKRGFDQCRILAETVARAYGTRPVNTLVKRRDSKSLTQVEGGMEVRRREVAQLYGLAVERELLKGKRVLLVDDVVTTGSTLEETSRVLRQGGASEVCCVTATKALQKEKKSETGMTETGERRKKTISLKKFVKER